ncbi:hypothetical protein REPUB_Repub16aG0023300 [Reevesia pubescens]
MISSAKVLRLNIILDLLVSDNSPAANAQLGVTDYAESPMRTLRTKEKHSGPDSGCGSPQAHSYLFGSDFVSVDALGKVLIISVPSLYFEDVMHSKHVSLSAKELQSSLKQDINHVKTSDGIMQTEAVPNITAYQTKSIKVDTVSTPQFCETDFLKEKMLDGVENLYTEAEISSEEEAVDNESRSLLSQSPMVRQPISAFSPDCVASTSKDNGSGCSSGKTLPSQSEVGGKESTQLPQVDKITANDDDDDQFYASLDLDAVEAEATLLLKNKSESSNIQNSGLQGSPSFDLGIW